MFQVILYFPFRQGSFLVIMRAVEAIDASTTICSSFEKGLKLHPINAMAPYVVGISSGIGGSVFRYLERNGRSVGSTKAEWCAPTGSIERVFAYVIAYSVLRKYFKDFKVARFIVVTYHVIKRCKELLGRKLTQVHILETLFSDFELLSAHRYLQDQDSP